MISTCKLSGKPGEMLGGGGRWEEPCDGLTIHPGGVVIPLVPSCYGNQDKLQLDGLLGSSSEYTFFYCQFLNV